MKLLGKWLGHVVVLITYGVAGFITWILTDYFRKILIPTPLAILVGAFCGFVIFILLTVCSGLFGRFFYLKSQKKYLNKKS
jgi:hypothetical protein